MVFQLATHDKIINQYTSTLFYGGEGGIRTHVPAYADHLISSQRRYDHFGTSPVYKKYIS